jgi:hypothetical protein
MKGRGKLGWPAAAVRFREAERREPRPAVVAAW